MVKARILQSYHPTEDNLHGLAWVHGKIWTSGNLDSSNRFHASKAHEDMHQNLQRINSPVAHPGGMTWDGQDFLVADRLQKQIYRINPNNNETTPLLLLTDLKQGDIGILQAPASQIADIAWGQGDLWVACQAGYSSSIFRIDPKKQAVVQRFWTRGPKPEGISFDQIEEYLWTIDARNKEFSQFTPKGEWTENSFSSPVEQPAGLALDPDYAFWTLDCDLKKVVQIKMEA